MIPKRQGRHEGGDELGDADRVIDIPGVTGREGRTRSGIPTESQLKNERLTLRGSVLGHEEEQPLIKGGRKTKKPLTMKWGKPTKKSCMSQLPRNRSHQRGCRGAHEVTTMKKSAFNGRVK